MITTDLQRLASLAGTPVPLLNNTNGAAYLWRIANAVEEYPDPADAVAFALRSMLPIAVWDAFADLRLYLTVDRLPGIGDIAPSEIAEHALRVAGERLATALADEAD